MTPDRFTFSPGVRKRQPGIYDRLYGRSFYTSARYDRVQLTELAQLLNQLYAIGRDDNELREVCERFTEGG